MTIIGSFLFEVTKPASCCIPHIAGYEGEPNVKTLRSPLCAEFWIHVEWRNSTPRFASTPKRRMEVYICLYSKNFYCRIINQYAFDINLLYICIPLLTSVLSANQHTEFWIQSRSGKQDVFTLQLFKEQSV